MRSSLGFFILNLRESFKDGAPKENFSGLPETVIGTPCNWAGILSRILTEKGLDEASLNIYRRRLMGTLVGALGADMKIDEVVSAIEDDLRLSDRWPYGTVQGTTKGSIFMSTGGTDKTTRLFPAIRSTRYVSDGWIALHTDMTVESLFYVLMIPGIQFVPFDEDSMLNGKCSGIIAIPDCKYANALQKYVEVCVLQLEAAGYIVVKKTQDGKLRPYTYLRKRWPYGIYNPKKSIPAFAKSWALIEPAKRLIFFDARLCEPAGPEVVCDSKFVTDSDIEEILALLPYRIVANRGVE